MNIAVILAGGTGSRMGADMPKQFLPLEGMPVIAHSIQAFDRSHCIDEIMVVVHPDWIDHMSMLARQYSCCKLRRIIPGGAERYMSSLHAIEALSAYPDNTNIILHDAARPWLTADIIQRVCEALLDSSAVGVGIPSTDTIWQVNQVDGTIQSIPNRSTMWRAQTPQAFRLPVIAEAYRRALADPQLQATDDCGVLLRYMPEVPIHIVSGEEQNRKITFAADLE